MSGRLFHSLNEAMGRVFPERRLYVRSDAGTRCWTLNPISQCGLAVVLSISVGWSGYASVAFVSQAMGGRTLENRLDATEDAYRIKIAALREQQRLLEKELNRSNTRGDAVTRELSKKQRLLVDTSTAYRTAEAELAGLRTEYRSLLRERRLGRDRLEQLHEEVVSLQLALAEAERDDRVMKDTLETFSRTMSNVIAARDTATERAEELDLRVADLEDEIGLWQGRQENLLAQLEEATSSSLESLDALFVGSDIDLDGILKATERDFTGRGGPFDAVSGRGPAPDETLDGERIASLMGDLERVSLMRVAIDRLPFGAPTVGTRLTSSFGPRRDPYRRRMSMHEGMDFAAPRGTPIYATAEGVVTFSGRQRGYGNVVKIRHAFGFETVYAHLSKSRVQVGQRVERGSRIADMGSTGRSTGSHLHYEVRIDGDPVNPNRFIKAARDVL